MSLDLSKLTLSIEDMVTIAQERGVTFSQAEIDDYANHSIQGGDSISVAQVILSKMPAVASILQNQNNEMEDVVQEVKNAYSRADKS